MREDLPWEEPLPERWSMSLSSTQGDKEGPSLEELHLVKHGDMGKYHGTCCRCWRVVQGRGDDRRHVLCELSVEIPEAMALQQLGRLREMMLREAKLLDSLSHDCIVPLEGGWLEQRTTGATFLREYTCRASEVNVQRPSGREGGLAISTPKTAPCSGHQPRWCGSQELCCGNAMDSFVRLCVPLTVSAEDSPDVHEDVLPQSQLSWGGDSNTDWRGTAEPKGAKHAECSAIDGAVSSTMPALPFNLKRCGCTGAPHGQWKKDQRSIRLTSYLLLPDWLPLCLWFEREFEPCVAGDDKSGVRGIDAAVMAAGDWANVWSQLRDMFLQVVSGVEFLHERGVVHNNLHLESVWVGTDGRCRVGNVSQATPPGCRRPPPKTEEASWHFASPERRRGCKVDSHSDVYSLGVLMLEFWRRYELSRDGHRDRSRTGSRGIVETAVMVRSGVGKEDGSAPTDSRRFELLDFPLVKRMLADDPFDRPDCFEIVDALADTSQGSSRSLS